MRRTIGIYAILACLGWGCHPDRTAVPFDSERVNDLATYMAGLHRQLPIPALYVVAIKGDSVYYQAHGEKSVRSTTDTVLAEFTPIFTGGVSQLMVVTAVMRLVAEGLLDIDDPVINHLPYFRLGDSDVAGVTIEHLMNQTGGVPPHANLWDYPDFSEEALANTTRSIRLQPAEFAVPGTRVKRSPYNYDILADIIAKVSGIPFEDYMQTNVLEPLGMEHSFFPKNNGFIDTVPRPHVIADWLTYAMDTIGPYPANREHSGSMGLHASAADLAKWLYMVVHHGVAADGTSFLPKRLADRTLSSFPVSPAAAVGFGWEIASNTAGRVYEQFHDIGGFSAHIALVPEKQLAVALVANISGDFDVRPISSTLIRWLSQRDSLKAERPLLAKALGERFAVTRNVDSVFSYYDSLVTDSPLTYDYSLESLSQLGINLLYRVEDTESAIAFFEACTARFPREPAAQLDLAEAYFANHRIPQCQEALEQARVLLTAGAATKGEGISTRMAMLTDAVTGLSTTNSNNNQ